MMKTEFLDTLEKELKRRHVSDTAEILSEYEQHFAFKLADGYPEEEVAAKLGAPAALAAQFEPMTHAARWPKKALTIAWLCIVDLFSACFFVLLFTWVVVMATFSLALAAGAVGLLLGPSEHVLIPPMPYWCGVIFALAFAALAVLAAVGCVYFAAFVRQLLRAYGRFHHNAMSGASGGAVLPPLAVHPQLSAKTNRRIRTVALVSLTLFAACFLLGMIACMFSAGALEFWHAWGWFGYMAG